MGDFIMMPKLGMTMTEGVVTKWLVGEGDVIEKGDYIFETETDKTTLEVDSLLSGTLLKIYHFEGDRVNVNEPVAFIGEEGEEAPELPASPDPDTADEASAGPSAASAAPVAGDPPRMVPAARADAAAGAGTAGGAVSKAERPKGAFDYDLVVIGSGPGGYVSAIRAAQLGAHVAIVEKNEIGGTCLNRGCIPTKAFYSSAKRYKDVKDAASLGIVADKVGFNWKKIKARKDAVIGQLRGNVESLLLKNGIDILKGKAHVTEAHKVKVGKKEYRAAFILIASGAVPASVVKSKTPIMTTDEALSLDKLPASIAIIGGGVIGCEIAGILNAFGVKTTIIELMPGILPAVDRDVAEALAYKMKGDGVDIRAGVTADDIKKTGKGYEITLSDGGMVKAGIVLEAVGRSPDQSAFSSLGVSLDEKGYIVTDAYMRTDVEGVYAIGDITGRHQLAHAASEQGILAVEHMFTGVNAPGPGLMPSCIFADMEIASVGLTEGQAKGKGLPYSVYRFPYAANGKALTLGKTEGFVKVIKDDRWDEILGVHIIGADASSLIEEAVMAMSLESTAAVAGGTIHPHPTLSETLMEAFLGVNGKAIHL
ncbi:MAG: dihydrolipoyl dehydrogenase [Clostridiales Family XIII bacterium]|jgi:dihydrolipoamide dehydrogenase|nr:dihydrolipoyl dehydrogenase [Clostridiales Family XIII bacterium]